MIAHVDVGITTQSSMLFFSFLPSTETVLVNLIFDLIRCISHINGRICVACGHLGLRTLQSGEEFGMDQGGLGVFQLGSSVASQSEIWILIDRARNQARDVALGAKYLREGV